MEKIDIYGVIKSINIQNGNALNLNALEINLIKEVYHDQYRSKFNKDWYLMNNQFGYNNIESVLPKGELKDAKSFELRRIGFQYKVVLSPPINYERVYNLKSGRLFGTTKNDITGYDKGRHVIN